ncbi:MAG: NADH dehydrogenase (quinone) subunit G [Anaerolineae bacterium]|nr:MAG: NADH dehydrogenase (quinone) subunit G [Anaerolineae bacterium]
MTREVTLTIDGKQVTVPAGTVIVDAARKAGIDIPVFCYHPKMEPVGMCRMCLVEVGRPMRDRATGEPILEEDGSPKIQFGPKLETACTVPVSEGMVVVGLSEKVQAARKDILEFLLTSHPLDCPICDKGGECPLQDLTMAYGPSESRFIYDEKMHLEKHVPLGDLIYLDRERCIQCARCIRFQDEIAGDAVLEFYHRGRHTDVITNSEPGFDSYWSGNTTDICPVGALTTADFRFGARPWELKNAASICTHCPVGCNLTYNTRREAKSGGNVVIKRAMPRQNEEVNELWICDKGRFAYHFAESEERLTQPLVRKNGELTPVDWDEALTLIASQFRNAGERLLTLVGGRLPNEDLFNLKQLTEGLGGKVALHTYMGGGEYVVRHGLSAGSNLGDLGAGDTVMVIASDLEEEAPLWYLRLKQAAERGAKLIVANPRPTKLERYAGEVVRYTYGQELSIFDDLKAKVAGATNLVIFFGSEGLGLAGSKALAAACADLFVSSGHENTKPNNGLVGVWPAANTQGAWELGFTAGADLGAASLLYIVAADPVSDDTAAAEAIQNADFTVVQDLFLSETAALADVVLPAQAQVEREGTFVSGERRLQRFYPIVTAPGQTRPDFDIAAAIGEKLDIELKGRFPSLVFPQICAQVPAFAGLTYQKLAEVHPQWPLVDRSDRYYGGTSYGNQQGLGVHLQAAEAREIPAAPTAPALPEAEIIAVPVTTLYDHGRMVAASPVLQPRLRKPFIRLHPADAQKLKTTDGMTVGLAVDGGPVAPVLVIEDPAVPQGFALVARSMGVPIHQPATFEIRIAETSMA